MRAERARAVRAVWGRGEGAGFSDAGIEVAASLSEGEGWLEWVGGGAETAWRAWWEGGWRMRWFSQRSMVRAGSEVRSVRARMCFGFGKMCG